MYQYVMPYAMECILNHDVQHNVPVWHQCCTLRNQHPDKAFGDPRVEKVVCVCVCVCVGARVTQHTSM